MSRRVGMHKRIENFGGAAELVGYVPALGVAISSRDEFRLTRHSHSRKHQSLDVLLKPIEGGVVPGVGEGRSPPKHPLDGSQLSGHSPQDESCVVQVAVREGHRECILQHVPPNPGEPLDFAPRGPKDSLPA
jgi:hypothetical protein